MAQILVVDDEPDVRELFNIMLRMAGHKTETAADGREAVDKLRAAPPDLVLLDLMMPHMDGFQLLAHLRTEQPALPLRVLVATARVLGEDDRRRLAAWPVVGVLNKGDLDIAQMVGLISDALGKSPFQPPASAPATSGNGHGAAPPRREAPPARPLNRASLPPAPPAPRHTAAQPPTPQLSDLRPSDRRPPARRTVDLPPEPPREAPAPPSALPPHAMVTRPLAFRPEDDPRAAQPPPHAMVTRRLTPRDALPPADEPLSPAPTDSPRAPKKPQRKGLLARLRDNLRS